jgi:hypothetical protein
MIQDRPRAAFRISASLSGFLSIAIVQQAVIDPRAPLPTQATD